MASAFDMALQPITSILGHAPTGIGCPRIANRRQFLGLATTIAVAPALLLPRKSFASTARPDEIDAGFWLSARSVRLVRPNTSQRIELTYWRDGAYLDDAYSELCFFLLDRRERLAVQMAPAVFDLTFATQRWFELATGKRATTTITDAYRTNRTNVLVGGAELSAHKVGAALDGLLDNVTLPTYAAMLLRFSAGGVGLYPRHVHWDVGRNPVFWRSSQAE